MSTCVYVWILHNSQINIFLLISFKMHDEYKIMNVQYVNKTYKYGLSEG